MTRFGYDTTDAEIIGGEHRTGGLFYEGRPQGSRFYGESDEELRERAWEEKRRIRGGLGEEAYARVYPEPIWELRIWD